MNEYQYAFDKLLTLDSPDVEQIEQLEVRGADYYHELLDTLHDLVEKETATTPDIEGDGYYKGELVYDTWICPGVALDMKSIMTNMSIVRSVANTLI